jgi:uncharacterized membrane protein HdeD (DUF308 family)
MNNETQLPSSALLDAIKENASLTVTSGVVLIVAGLLALLAPLVAGLSITIMVGVLLIISGISQCVLAFKAGAFGKGLLMFLIGALMAIAGSYMTSQPVSGLASITLLLAAYLIAAGLCDLVAAFNIRPAPGWGLELFNGIITLALGIMLWRQYPLSGAWAVGILFGIKMVFSGWALVFLGRSVKGAAQAAESAP